MGELLTTYKSFKLVLMIKIIIKSFVCLVTLATYNFATAQDLYLNASNADEITITSTASEGENTIVVEDTTPIENSLATTKITQNS